METVLISNLKRHMFARGLNSRELALRANVKPSFIYDILNGKSSNPSSIRLSQVANILGVSLQQLVCMEDEANAQPPHKPSFTFPPATNIVMPLLERTHLKSEHGGFEEPAWGKVHFEKEWLQEHTESAVRNLCLVEVKEETMAPTLVPGDLVMLDREVKTIIHAGIYALAHENGFSIKRFEPYYEKNMQRLRVVHDNIYYGSYETCRHDINVFGKVVWTSKWL